MIRLYRILYPYFRPYRKIFWTGVAFMLVANGLAYLQPWGAGYIMDHVFPRLHEPGGIGLLLQWVGLFILIGLMRAVCIFFMIHSYWSIGTKVIRDLRNQLYDKLQELSFSFYSRARVGDLMSRLTQDVEMVRNFYAYMIEHRSQIILYLTIISGLLLATDWKLTLVCLAVTPFAVYTVMNFSIKMRGAVIERQTQVGALNAFVQENITGIRVVKAFAMEDEEMAKFKTHNQLMQRRNLNVTTLQAVLHPFLILCGSLGTVAILWYGGYRVAQGQLTIGRFVAFISYLGMTAWPLGMLAPNTNQLRQAEGSARRLLELFNQTSEIRPPADGGIIIPKLKGRVELLNVSFSYPDDPEQVILREIALKVKPGEKVAIIGLTGSGKSTLINLIPRFYDPRDGRILIDGVDLRDLNIRWWRRQVGLVLQETFLFSATIRDNIAFGRPEASLNEIEQAAEAAQIADFIHSLPDGYDTVVGERGVGLSGGQKQRIAIARAILTDPKILILDDSTSSVDVETEQAIQESLKRLMIGRTTIMIAQRLSTAQLADRIVILESGEIRAQGSHEQLLVEDLFYQHLYHIQTFDETPAESA